MEEIESLIKKSSTSSLLISENPSKEFPGYVREVHIRYLNRVSVSYEPNGTRAGGASFWAQYPTMAKAVRSVEEFLGIPVSEWKIPLSSTSFPKAQQIRYSSESDFLIADAIEQNRIPLPSGAFRIISPGWRFYKEFKSEHSSKIDAAMEEPDPYFALQCYARELSASGRKRDDIMGVFSAAHAFYMRLGAAEDTVADVMDGISNTFGRGNQNNLNLPLKPFPADIHHLKVIQKNGNKISAQLLVWTMAPDSPESVKMSLTFPGRKIEATAGDFSSALTTLRQRLEENDLLLQSTGLKALDGTP